MVCGEFRIFCSEIVHARSDQRLDRFLDDQADQIVGRVVAARSLPREDVRADGDLSVIADDLVFEQALVDRAKLLNAKITVVDVTAAMGGCSNESASMTSAMTSSPSRMLASSGTRWRSKSPPL